MWENSIPILIACTKPFRLISRDINDGWEATLDDINNNSYDYVKLHRLTKFIDINHQKPFKLAVSFDGCFILPALPEYKNKENALTVLNRYIGELLFGGIYFEAFKPIDIGYGELFFTGYFISHSRSQSSSSSFHQDIEGKTAGIVERINLFKPEIIEFSVIESSINMGRETLENFPNLSISIIVNSITYLVNNQWAESLSNSWTSIEQVIDHYWEYEIIKPDESIKSISGRGAFLKDYRVWVTSSKIELLYQRKFIDLPTYNLLNIARKARNALIHEGKIPSKQQALSAIKALFSLISLFNSGFKDNSKLFHLVNIISSFDKFKLEENFKINNSDVKCWMPILPIPGENKWGNESYEVIKDIQLVKIKKEN